MLEMLVNHVFILSKKNFFFQKIKIFFYKIKKFFFHQISKIISKPYCFDKYSA